MFEFEPKVVFIGGIRYASSSIVMVRDGNSAVYILGDFYMGFQVVSWNGNTVTWYLNYTQRKDADMQLNESGTTYYYVTIS